MTQESTVVYQKELFLWAGFNGAFDMVIRTEGDDATRLGEEIEDAILDKADKVTIADLLIEPTRVGKYRITIEKLEEERIKH